MDGKYIALGALAAGVGLIIGGFSTMGDGATGLDRLPLTILMILGGGVLVVGSAVYFLVRAFVAL